MSFEQSTYTVAEGSSVQVKVTLDADPERTITIPIVKTDQGGATASDYSGVQESVVFSSGETEQTFTFEAAADSDNDDGESVKLGFGATLPTGVSAGDPSEATVSITDDDVPSVSVSFGQATYTVAEGSSVQVKVTLDADPERTVIIPIVKTDQGGASSDDYSSVPTTVTFTSGETEQTFTFTAASDDVDDDDESVRLGFGATLPTGVNTGSTNETTISITDDDVPSVSVSFEQATYTVAEGSSVQVKVTLDADPERTVIIPIVKTDQGGATSDDYSSVPETVTFDDGETEQTFTFTAAADSDNDDGESIKLGFGATLPMGVNTGTPNETTISITDDDVPSVSVSFEQATYTVAEGSSVQVKVTLDADPERTVTIPLTATDQGGATASDYSDVPETVTITSGETEQTFTFTAASDDVDDDGESIKLGFGATLPTGVSTGTPSETTVSITDDDDPSVFVSFEQATYTVAEGSSVQVKVTLDADPERTVIIPIVKTDQGGATSDDYSSVPTTVTFTSGETEQTFTFTAASDDVDDDDESVKLGFGATLPTGVSAGDPNEATVSITDDDVPSVSVSFEQATYTVAEGSSVQVKVTLDADPERTVIIPIVKTDQGGATSDDYSSVPDHRHLRRAGRRSRPSLSRLPPTTWMTMTRAVKLGFGATLPTGVSTGDPNEATVSITDDDVPQVVVSFEQATYTVAEGSSVQVKVTLDADPERTVIISLTATDQGGASSEDYSDVPTTVTFDDGETEQSFTFEAASDDVDDDDESVRLGFGATLPTGVNTGSTNETTISITDDDVPSVSVSFEQSTYTVAEGSSVQVKVTLDADPERTVTIPLTSTDQGGATSDDYSSVPTDVTFDDGETKQTFTFTAASDDVDDDGESVKLGFGATLPTGVSAGDPNETTVSITDDDVPQVVVSFQQATYTVAEGSSVQVKVTLDADPERTVIISLTATDQGGASSEDYSDVPTTVTFDDGETEQSFTFDGGLRRRGRRRREREAGLQGHPADGRQRRRSERDNRLHHRRRRAVGVRELPAGDLHGGRGEQRTGQGDPRRRP